MTQKIAVSVPDDLHEKMQKYKDSFNYSGLFQDVVSREIQKKEDFQARLKGDASMNEIIERLKKERNESEEAYHEQGKTEGLDWAKASHYDEIQVALKFAGEWQYGYAVYDYLDRDDNNYDSWTEYWGDIIKNDACFNENESGPNDCLNRFVQGWIEGVQEFWNEVESKIKA